MLLGEKECRPKKCKSTPVKINIEQIVVPECLSCDRFKGRKNSIRHLYKTKFRWNPHTFHLIYLVEQKINITIHGEKKNNHGIYR